MVATVGCASSSSVASLSICEAKRPDTPDRTHSHRKMAPIRGRWDGSGASKCFTVSRKAVDVDLLRRATSSCATMTLRMAAAAARTMGD